MKIKCESCGKEFDRERCKLERNKHNFCSKKCMYDYFKIHPRNIKDLTGRQFGRLTVIEYVGTKARSALWKCKCECGKEKIVNTSNLTMGNTTSCGCYQAELVGNMHRTHGLSNERLYNTWKHMLARCEKETMHNYNDYGGRGISVCEEWHDLKAFMDWALKNGYKDDLTIDRIDVNGNYEPSNCRWSTAKEQNENKRNNHFITYKGEIKTLAEWCEKLKIKRSTLNNRITRGWTIERAFTEKVNIKAAYGDKNRINLQRQNSNY